jgi:hypothetical protein
VNGASWPTQIGFQQLASRYYQAVAKKKKATPPKAAAPRAAAAAAGHGGRVRKLSPEAPAARDEGPRLIPLGSPRHVEHPQLSKYIELADKMLGTDKPKR